MKICYGCKVELDPGEAELLADVLDGLVLAALPFGMDAAIGDQMVVTGPTTEAEMLGASEDSEGRIVWCASCVESIFRSALNQAMHFEELRRESY